MIRFHEFPAMPTSPEVAAVIRARHHDDLAVYSSYSSPKRGVMETCYGIKGEDIPLLGFVTTWDVTLDLYERRNEKHSHFLLFREKDNG